MESEAQGRGSAFTLCHALLKKAILHHTEAAMPFFVSTSVYNSMKRVVEFNSVSGEIQ